MDIPTSVSGIYKKQADPYENDEGIRAIFVIISFWRFDYIDKGSYGDFDFSKGNYNGNISFLVSQKSIDQIKEDMDVFIWINSKKHEKK